MFVGRHYPNLDNSWNPDDFGEAVAGLGFTVVVYDSMREFLTCLGFNPNDDADISSFFALCITPLIRREVAVVMLDNTGHVETHRPKGSGSKLDAAPQAYRVQTVSKFTPTQTGSISIECTRSRYGDEGRKWAMRVGGDVFDVPSPTTEAPDADRARKAAAAREKFRTACIAVLTEQSPLGRDDLIAGARKHGGKGRATTLRGWLAYLAADPTSGLRHSGEDGYSLDVENDAEGGGPDCRGPPWDHPPRWPPWFPPP